MQPPLSEARGTSTCKAGPAPSSEFSFGIVNTHVFRSTETGSHKNIQRSRKEGKVKQCNFERKQNVERGSHLFSQAICWYLQLLNLFQSRNFRKTSENCLQRSCPLVSSSYTLPGIYIDHQITNAGASTHLPPTGSISRVGFVQFYCFHRDSDHPNQSMCLKSMESCWQCVFIRNRAFIYLSVWLLENSWTTSWKFTT